MRQFKHVDVLAIAFLLGGIALLSQARQSSVLRYESARLVQLTNRQILPVLENPQMPKICLTRD